MADTGVQTPYQSPSGRPTPPRRLKWGEPLGMVAGRNEDDTVMHAVLMVRAVREPMEGAN